MSLYYYAKSKAELISAMDDALMAKVLVPTLPEDWGEALTAIALRTRDVFVRHPWALSSMQSAPPGVNAMLHMEQCLEALAKTSMTTEEKLTLLALVDDFVFGYTLRETAGDPVVDIDAARKRLATGAFPELTKAFGKERRLYIPNRFDLGLEAIFDKFSDRGLMGTARPRRRRRNPPSNFDAFVRHLHSFQSLSARNRRKATHVPAFQPKPVDSSRPR
jgi:hypothetical protein